MDIRDNPEHRAMIRESQLAAGQIAAGATALAKANHACTAYYHQAFFGLSIGMERVCKQILIADYAIRQGGRFPPFSEVKKFGHKLVDLIEACDEVGKRFATERSHPNRPASAIHQAILGVLGEFADGTRYYNLDFLTSSSKKAEDPVAAWWRRVGLPICERHYSARAQVRDAQQAQLLAAMLQDGVMIHHTSETGEHIGDFETFASMAGPTRVVQRYGKMYALQIVRWLQCLTFELAMTSGYEKQIPGLFCFHEPYSIFSGTDADFRTRMTFDVAPG